MEPSRPTRILAIIGPGLLVAATGVGAGDLATASFTGSRLGPAVLWAVVAGAFLKFVLNEGLARWQLATGKTFLEGVVDSLGAVAAWVFLPYLLLWSFFVGAALMSACGVAAHALVPFFDEARQAKIVLGAGHSALGVVLVLAGGFRLFERVMRVCIGVMFLTVVLTAMALWPGTGEVLGGLLIPAKSTLRGEGLTWTVALLGGVGGTVTVLCYGYWIREEGREGADALPLCRVDLAVGYLMTALFGGAMVIIGSRVPVDGKGAQLVVDLAGRLEEPMGPAGRWVFLVGAWGAVFSSLLGVWQAVPYLFADFCRRLKGPSDRRSAGNERPLTTSRPYRAYLLGLATLPAIGLVHDFREIQKLYAIVGACFIPLLALALLVMNGSARRVGPRLRNRWSTSLVLLATLAFFTWIVWTRCRS